MKVTILGSSGFIGSELAHHFRNKGYVVDCPSRSHLSKLSGKLGHVVYAIGMTGDFRSRPNDTVDAHVTQLQNLLKKSDFDSWLYLSSTRIYQHSEYPTSEEACINVLPGADGIYDISKLLGESLCLATQKKNVRIARLSNVFGRSQSKETFLGSLLSDVKNSGKILIQEAEYSSKDYISIKDCIEILEKIMLFGRSQIYNVASGRNVDHITIANLLIEHSKSQLAFSQDGISRKQPRIDIRRIKTEFDFSPRDFKKEFLSLLN